MGDEILTREELANYLKLTPRTIDRLRKTGLPCFKIGDSVRFKKDEVLKWIDEQNKK